MTVINIGAPAIDRALYFGSAHTFLLKDGPANAAGRLTEIQFYVASAFASCKFGTFYGSFPNFTRRDYVSLGFFAIGYHRITGLNIDVHIGDYIGGYHLVTSGIDYLSTSGQGVYWKAGDGFIGGAHAYTLSSHETSIISLCGIGATVGGRSLSMGGVV